MVALLAPSMRCSHMGPLCALFQATTWSITLLCRISVCFRSQTAHCPMHIMQSNSQTKIKPTNCHSLTTQYEKEPSGYFTWCSPPPPVLTGTEHLRRHWAHKPMPRIPEDSCFMETFQDQLLWMSKNIFDW